MLLAGFYSLVSDQPCSPELAARLVEDLDFVEEAADAAVTDEWECLNHLLTLKVQVKGDEGYMLDQTIGEAITSGQVRAHDCLKNYGVIVDQDAILIVNEHTMLRQIYGRTRWSNWRKSLMRLQGATIADRKWFGTKQSRCVRIPRVLFS